MKHMFNRANTIVPYYCVVSDHWSKDIYILCTSNIKDK